MWRGVGPTSQRAGVIAGVELPVYDASKRYLIDHNILPDSFPNHLASSFVASLAAAIGSTPLDVIRVRYQFITCILIVLKWHNLCFIYVIYLCFVFLFTD